MKFNTPLHNLIHEPRNTDWDKISSNSLGILRKSNIKILFDFANIRNDDALKYFQKKIVNISNRIYHSQLNKYSLKSYTKIKLLFYLFSLVFMIGINDMAIAQTLVSYDSSSISSGYEINGNVKDENNINLDFCSITASIGGVIKYGTKSDINGDFKITKLKEGIYSISFTYPGYKKFTIDSVRIGKETKSLVGIKLEKQIVSNKIFSCRQKSIDPQNPYLRTFTKEQLNHFPR